MKKLSLNTLQRMSILMALNGHKITDLGLYNRALKIVEVTELSQGEKEKINFVQRKDGSIVWGQDEAGNLLPDFKDIVKDIELSDDKSDFLKTVIEDKIKEGISLANPIDKATVEVQTQLIDPARTE